MKKILIIVIIVLLISTLSFVGMGCATKTTTTVAIEMAESSTTTAKSDQDIVIGLSMPELVSPYWRLWIQAFEKNINKLGWKYISTDASGNIDNQINQIEDLYSKGVKGLVIVPLDAKGIIPVINKVYEESGKKFPMLTANVMTDPAQIDSLKGFAGPNCYDEAAKLSEAFIDLLEKDGTDKINGVMITGLPGYSDTNDRQKGFTDTIEKLGWKDKVNFLDIQPGNWALEEATKVMENFITAYEDKIEFVYAQDGTMAYGAWNALEASGYKPGQVILLGIGGQKEELKMIQDGIQSMTVNQSIAADSAKALEVLQKIFNGDEIEYFNFIDTPIITKENVDQFLPGEW